MDTNLFLLQSFDSLFPIGAFTLSNGMETYVQKEIVCDRESLEKYLDSFLYVMPYNDLGFAAFVMRGGDVRLCDALCAGSKSPQELRDGSKKLCRRFIKAQKEILGSAGVGGSTAAATLGAEADTPALGASPARANSPATALLEYEAGFSKGGLHGMYPVALGLYFRALCKTPAEQKSALTFYAYSQITNLVNHAVKLVPLGQLEGQKALYNALQKLDAVVEKALNVKEDELGFGGCGFDFRSMQHETLYSRLYIS